MTLYFCTNCLSPCVGNWHHEEIVDGCRESLEKQKPTLLHQNLTPGGGLI